MNTNSGSSGRRAAEYILFALAFIGIVIAASGIIVSSPNLALTGVILALLALGGSLLGASSRD